MPHQPSLIPTEPTPDQAARDAERAEYLERLRRHLQDPAFRQIEGFPLGDDEAILTLSDPPYYTACPNPFLAEIIEKWQREKLGVQSSEFGVPGSEPGTLNLEPETDNYHREPFAADVSEGKNDPIYNAHSYHTKVPHKAIMRYILHYTEPGDIVFDGFCGTGMTGVAAQLCGDKKEVESLGYFVDDDGNIYDRRPPTADRPAAKKSPLPPGSSAPLPISKLGARKAVLCDLSPAATFIAYNYNTPVDIASFETEAKYLLTEAESKCGWMYETLHVDAKTKGKINWTVWSDIFQCPECGIEMIFWDVGVDKDTGVVRDSWSCVGCGVSLAKSPKSESGSLKVERAWETIYDKGLGKTIRRAKQVPVLINYSVGRKRHEKHPDIEDLALISRIEDIATPYWFPNNRIPEGDKTSDPFNIGISHIHHFYSRRNLITFSTLWHFTTEKSILGVLQGGYTVGLRTARFLPLRWVQRDTGPMKPHTAGTLYVPSLNGEQNWLNIAASRIAAVSRQLGSIKPHSEKHTCISTNSASSSYLNDSSIDYIFVDPPFGANLMYSELNFLSEAWLKVFTNNQAEAVISKTQRKGLLEYQYWTERCFREFYRVLKPGRWLTVEFHNSQNSVWNAIQEAILRAGFMVADVRTFNKQQGTFNQVTATGSVKQDLIISAYKPTTDFEQGFLAEGGREKGAWEFIRQHLEQLPIVVERPASASDSALALEIIAERQAYLLYDRMVAFHIQRGFSVPLSAAEFYAGLRQRFPERDGMYFLPTQAAEYDQRRLRDSKVEQLALFVTDEKSALQWLQRELDPETGSGSQTYQDLQPKFLRELHQARHEKLPELRHLLEENFLQDEQERWFIPNPERQEHLEQLREKSLLREFQDYSAGKGRLKIFRTEAVRAGFKRAWAEKNYSLIVQVAQRLPESVLQEDPGLLMYYDNALMRVEKEPRQGQLL